MDSNKKNSSEKSLSQSNEKMLQEAEALIWALLDEEIAPADAERLEILIKENEEIRQRYINCVHMHTDLVEHFGAKPATTTSPEVPKSPVLGSLGNPSPNTDILPPVAE